jgi:hypothetical protein
MAQNPYYISPLGGYGPSIVQGIGGIAKGYREQQMEEQEAQTKQDMATAAQAAFDSGDPNQVASLMFKYPDMKDTITAAVGHRDEATKQNMASTIRAILANPDKAGQIMQSRADSLTQVYGDDVDMGDTLGSIEEYNQDPEGFLRQVEMMAPAYLSDQEWEAYSEKRETPEGFTLAQGQQRFDAQGRPIAQVAPKPTAFQLKPGEQRFEDGKVVATGAPVAAPVIPTELIANLPADVASKASAAFSAAGGGKDGVKAAVVQIDKGGEQARRQASSQIIQESFPNASPAEKQQLQATMDAAKTTESGLKAAEKARVEQRRTKKAQVFQTKAVELLTGILANPQLGDVLGSIEGNIDVRLFSDAESELIADIKEAANILTADNLDLMSGVLSETDIKILQNLSGGALNRTRTEKRFIKDVTELRDRLSSSLVTTVDDQANQSDAADIERKKARLAELRAKAGQ